MELKIGQYAMCWYLKNKSDSHELELYYCKILKIGKQYVTCLLYYGETFNTKKVKGVCDDVCLSDIQEFDNSVDENPILNMDCRDILINEIREYESLDHFSKSIMRWRNKHFWLCHENTSGKIQCVEYSYEDLYKHLEELTNPELVEFYREIIRQKSKMM
jgi:hypothetical protein